MNVDQQQGKGCSHSHDTVLVLKSDSQTEWLLRHDVRRAVLYELEKDTYTLRNSGIVHPAEAVVLALLDGNRTLGDLEGDLTQLFDISRERICAWIDQLLLRRADALASPNGALEHLYDPTAFVIPAHMIDVESFRLYRPLHMLFHVSDDCMRSCIYCNVQKRAVPSIQLLPLSRWDELAAECKQLDMPSINLSGGDPLMRRDVIDIVHAFTSRGMIPFISTKGYVSEALARRLAGEGVRCVQVSVDAVTDGMAEYMTRSRGFLRQATSSIEHLIAAGISVRCNCVLTRHNLREAPRLICMLWDLGVNMVSLSGFARSLYVDNNDDLFLNASDRAWIETEVRNLERDGKHLRVSVEQRSESSVLDRAARFDGRATCSAGRSGLVVHSDGKVTLCDEMPLDEVNVVGDLSQQSIMEVWRSPRIDELLLPDQRHFVGTVCYECEEYVMCHLRRGRCFRDALKAFGRFHAPTPDCPRAPAGLRVD